MANVTQYNVIFHGTEDGYLGRRAQINLFDGTTFLGGVQFHDAGMPFPNDSQHGGQISMHLPSSMLENVLDVLRNEEPIAFWFLNTHAFLGTDNEPTGEAE